MIKKYDIILFDLDGTLLDTSRGIYNSVRYAEKNMNLDPIPDDRLRQFVGPPPAVMYREMYGISEEEAHKATIYHREYGKEFAIYEAEVYEGMIDCLNELKKEGFLLGVATLKSEMIAKKILDNFNISQYFDVVCGMNKEENLSKADVIRNAKHKLGPGNAILIGDTMYDYTGAKEAGIDFGAVLYGFGLRENHIGEDCIFAVSSPKCILTHLLRKSS